MNLLLLPEQCHPQSRCTVSNRQHRHIKEVLKLAVGDTLRVGVVNGAVGRAKVAAISATTTELEILALDDEPPTTLPLTLILALPRPQMIKRILQTIATLGVEELHLIQTGRVEKSFWQSPSTTDAAIDEHLQLGLEQAMATQLPRVYKHPRFRPFAEDTLPTINYREHKLLAHPGDFIPCPTLALPDGKQSSLLAIGPEGGFTDTEVDWLVDAGFTPFQTGDRILKVETAVTAIISKLY